MITQDQVQACKDALLNRQSELIQFIREQEETRKMFTEVSGELSSYDNHPADLGTELFERSKDYALSERAEKELEEINQALHAIAEGTYGICTICGKDIPYERLRALPTTDRCKEHTEQNDLDKVNTQNLQLSSHRMAKEEAWRDVSRYGTSDDLDDDYVDDDLYVDEDYNDEIERFMKKIKHKEEW